jgi:hypothetical protein
MDKTIQIVVVALLLLITAVGVMTIFSSQLDAVPDLVNKQKDGASCSIQETNYKNACDCSGSTGEQETKKAREIHERTSENCVWTDKTCGDYCS